LFIVVVVVVLVVLNICEKLSEVKWLRKEPFPRHCDVERPVLNRPRAFESSRVGVAKAQG